MQTLPRLAGQWIAIPGRVTPDQRLRVSVVAALTVESDGKCETIEELDLKISGLKELITKWPTIVRALKEWTVTGPPGVSNPSVLVPAIGVAPLPLWEDVNWPGLWFRCEDKSRRAADPPIVSSSTVVAGTVIQNIHRAVRRAILLKGAELQNGPGPGEGAFSRLIELPTTLGSFELEALAITQSRYRPEHDAAPKNTDVARGLKAARWRALDPTGKGQHLTPAVREYLSRGTITGLETLRGHGAIPSMVDYFTARALPCPPAEHELLKEFQEWWNGFLAYPTLARLFGIIVEVDVTCAVSSLRPGDQFKLQALPIVPNVPEIPVPCQELLRKHFQSLWTQCTNLIVPSHDTNVMPPGDTRVVVVTPADDSTTLAGLADLTDCRLDSTNADDAISKMRAAAEAERTKLDSGTLEVEKDQTLPSGSTWGLALQNGKLAERLKKRQENPNAPTGSEEYPLRAPQLRAGFRYDVMVRSPADDRTPWRSLCRRHVVYDDNGPNRIDCERSETLRRLEEGIVRTVGRMFATDKDGFALTTANLSAAGRVEGHVLADELFIWTDWPLCVPPDTYPPPPQPPVKIPIEQQLTIARDHDITLRFGREYAVSGRDAYFDGGGLSTEEAAALRETIVAADPKGIVPYERFEVFERVEPLRPPEIHLAEPIRPAEQPGDQIDHIVVRSGPDVKSEARRSRRYVLAPRASTEFAGLHAHAFDALGRDIDLPPGAFHGVAFTCLGDVPTVHWVHKNLGENHLPGKLEDLRADDTLVVFDRKRADEVVHEHYTDPEVRFIRGGIVEHHASCWGDEIPPFDVYRGRRWPDARLFRIDVKADERQTPRGCSASWEREGGTALEIELAPAAEVVLKLWSAPSDEALSRMQAYRGTLEIASNHKLVLRDLSVPFINPTREIRLIHAVQKPLLTPRFGPDANVGRRTLHDAAALFEGYATIHRASTVQLEVFATTRVFIDDVKQHPNGPEWEERMSTNAVVTIDNIGRDAAYPDRIAFDVDDDGVKRARLHEIGSPKRHSVTYWLEAVSRYTPYFPKQTVRNFCRTTKEDAERADATWKVDILSSSPPAAPDVRTVTPIFRQSEHHGREGDEVSRRCVGFRLRLGRPFFTTGNGQRLAVVCWPPGTFGPGRTFPQRRASVGSQSLEAETIPRDLEPFVSRIAEDPVWPGAAPFELLPPDFFAGGAVGTEMIDFPGAIDQRVDDISDIPQRLEGSTQTPPAVRQAETPVSIVSFPVDPDSCDATAQEFFCDVGVAAAALARRPEDQPYFPFLRLALAGHQPLSVPGASLSPIVVADLVQVHPDRFAQVIYQRVSGRARLIVRGFGQPEFIASTKAKELLEHDNVAFLLRAQLLRRTGDDAVEVPAGPPVTLAIDRDRDGYFASWDLPMHVLASRSDRFVLFVEEVWLVPTDPHTDPPLEVGAAMRATIPLHSPRYFPPRSVPEAAAPPSAAKCEDQKLNCEEPKVRCCWHEHPRVLLRLPLMTWTSDRET